MSTNFQSCPGCDSFILSDTAQCPECGHVLDEKRIGGRDTSDLKTQQMYDTCRNCGESVRSGLVRCWNCNTFMREDVAARYEEMQATPQHIIFSDIPEDQRTELISDRTKGGGYGARVFDAVDDESEFTLSVAQRDFEHAPAAPPADQAAAGVESSAVSPAEEATPVQQQTEQPEAPTSDVSSEDKASAETRSSSGEATNEETDLIGLAIQDQRETRRKKRNQIARSRRQKVLLPCTACGSWMRVHREQSGKIVRCGQCKARIVVPLIKKKDKPAGADSKTTTTVQVDWMEDVRMHIISPTEVVLKPGSMAKGFEVADVAVHQSGLHLILFAAPAKKSLFGKATDGPPSVDEQRQRVREHIESTGKFSDVPFGTLYSISADQIGDIRLVQPVSEVHASMFAGVSVFGDGQIAVHLPLTMAEDKQAFLSFPLSSWRQISERLNKVLNFSMNTAENGVPDGEEYKTQTCEISNESFQALQNVVYYENDPAYGLEVAGYACEKCGITVSEEGRARKKLGGAKAKGIAKAKCPKCTSKMGEQKLWKLVGNVSGQEKGEGGRESTAVNSDSDVSPETTAEN